MTARRLASELAVLLDRPSYAREARATAEAVADIDGAGCAAAALIACVEAGRMALGGQSAALAAT